MDRWQPRVGDEEQGRKEQPDHDGRDERSVEGVKSAPGDAGQPLARPVAATARRPTHPLRFQGLMPGPQGHPRRALVPRPTPPSPPTCGCLLAGYRSARSHLRRLPVVLRFHTGGTADPQTSRRRVVHLAGAGAARPLPTRSRGYRARRLRSGTSLRRPVRRRGRGPRPRRGRSRSADDPADKATPETRIGDV